MKNIYILSICLIIALSINAQGKFGGGNADGYSSQSINNIVLPLQTLELQAAYKNRTVEVTWTTTNEMNIALFEIQRSVNGREWQHIAREQPKGSLHNNYRIIDTDPQQGISYYRIRVVEADGRLTYSQVVTINIAGLLSFSVYPNPVKQELYIRVAERNNSLSITDASGRVIKRWAVVPQKIDLSHLLPGIYMVRIGTEAMQIVKQ